MHINSGNCPKCEEIFNLYPGFYEPLKSWFKDLQQANPDAHVSCAGRGKIQQEEYFQRGATRAHYGQSSHNFNAAIDIFQLKDGTTATWDKTWFSAVVGPALYASFKWYGAPGAVFYELPHVELAGWKSLVQTGELKLVE